MAELREAKDLQCPHCLGTLFIAVVAVRHNAGGGTVYPPRGHQCLGCNELISVAEILRYEEVQVLERQLSALRTKQAQMGGAPKDETKEEAPAAPPATSTTRRS